jgi:ubiquinone/menaquinone biosynthesis C-methylase UbiE
VLAAITRHARRTPETILDIGAADGMMIDLLRPAFDDSVYFIAADLSAELLQFVARSRTGVVQSEASALPFASDSMDVVVATAIIEHVANPERMVAEMSRVLRAGGLLVMTTPTPHLEALATRIGLLDDDQHNRTFYAKDLAALLEPAGFGVLEAYGFMFSPVGFPAETVIERVLRAAGLSCLLANQLIVARLNA